MPTRLQFLIMRLLFYMRVRVGEGGRGCVIIRGTFLPVGLLVSVTTDWVFVRFLHVAVTPV